MAVLIGNSEARVPHPQKRGANRVSRDGKNHVGVYDNHFQAIQDFGVRH